MRKIVNNSLNDTGWLSFGAMQWINALWKLKPHDAWVYNVCPSSTRRQHFWDNRLCWCDSLEHKPTKSTKSTGSQKPERKGDHRVASEPWCMTSEVQNSTTATYSRSLTNIEPFLTSINIVGAPSKVDVSLFCDILRKFKLLTPVRKVLFHLRHSKNNTL